MKHGTFEEYTKSDLQLPQQALLTAWDFRLNNQHQASEFADESMLIRQQCVTLAEALLA